MATMLVFNMEGPRRAKLNMICMRHKIRIRAVEKEEFGLTLGALCGKMPAEGAAEVTPFDEEMIVMADFTTTLANAFLMSWRQAKQAPIRLKAVLTPTNVTWNAVELYKELDEENRALSNGEQAHKGTPSP